MIWEFCLQHFSQKRFEEASSRFSFFIDSNGMMMVLQKNWKKKVWKLPWRFSISGHLYKCTQSCFSLSCNQVTCVKTSFFSPIFLEIMVISCQQTKNETSSFQTVGNICSPVLSVKREWIGGLGASHFTLSVIRVVNPVFWEFEIFLIRASEASFIFEKT